MTLTVFEFMRRFLLHILPHQFFKIRYYGIFSHCKRKRKLKICKEVLGVLNTDNEEHAKELSWEELLQKLTGEDPRICPVCGKGQMVKKLKLEPIIRLFPIINPPPLEAMV